MLRMNNVLFDQQGGVKVQDMSHVHFDEFEVKDTDLIFLPPESLSGSTKQSCNSDVWTLGMILLHCMCLTYQQEEGITADSLLSLYKKAKGQSLINLEPTVNPDQDHKSGTLSDHSASGKKDQNWMDIMANEGEEPML